MTNGLFADSENWKDGAWISMPLIQIFGQSSAENGWIIFSMSQMDSNVTCDFAVDWGRGQNSLDVVCDFIMDLGKCPVNEWESTYIQLDLTFTQTLQKSL